MKTFIVTLLIAAVSLTAAFAEEGPSAVPRTPATLSPGDRLPGVDLAQGISEITGVAISPLLGVCSIGAWHYYHTPKPFRNTLPWFCHPHFWGFGFSLLGLCFLKDLFGAVAPPLIKKPFDIAELFENKLSALVASTAFVPLIAGEMARHLSDSTGAQVVVQHSAYFASLFPVDAIEFGIQLLLFPFCILSFLVVWMACHAINVVIAFCPIGFVDALLKLVKMALLLCFVLSYVIDPYLGAAVSLLIIVAAGWFAPSAFRLSVFGALFATDTLMPNRARRPVAPDGAHAFTAHASLGVPARTYGRVTRAPDGAICFSYRPWLILPRRHIPLPKGALAICAGVYFPSLLYRPESSEAFTRIILFLPRFRGQEQAIAGYFDITDIRDSALSRGFKAVHAWFAEILNTGNANPAESPRIGNI